MTRGLGATAAAPVSVLWTALRITEHVMAGIAGLLGPVGLRVVLGDTLDLSAGRAAGLATGCAMAIASLVLMVGLLARGGRPRRQAPER